ncbi:MAG: 4-hydroxythreonine-4-phosphate dehydrogenase PdxA [Bernardetiaceae bacterium]
MTEKTNDKPRIGITIGDFNGIGPEVILKTLADERIFRQLTPVLYASAKVVARYKKILDLNLAYHKSGPHNDFLLEEDKLNLVTCWTDNVSIQPGKVTEEAARCAFLSIKHSTDALKRGDIEAIVTAPINKDSLQKVGFSFPGHTEYYAEAAGASFSLMMMVSETFRIGMLTGHVPLREVSENITEAELSIKLQLMIESLKKDFGIARPKIAVLGLNPHAGENGALGEEEQRVIIPVIEKMKNKGDLVFGPFPADGFFGRQQQHSFDAVMAMYHDQGLIPFKSQHFEKGVNFTAGLPTLLRTSVDHGTAYDIAGKGIADESSMREAIFLACDIARRRRSYAL